MHRIIFFLLSLSLAAPLHAQKSALRYKPAPADNPLKGLVPYWGQGDPFPHSMEFWYFPLKQLMTGPGRFDWQPIERKLSDITGRGCQGVFRVYIEYPGKESALPGFLADQGVKVTRYTHDGNANHTPDYNDPRMRRAMTSFIEAFGKRYDGDPRIGFITMGMLGHWGEWHTYPKDDLFASEEVQAEVMDSFQRAFEKTKVLMRYPAGTDAWKKAPNHERSFGYHDDSFAFATLDTGREQDSWFFESLLQAAGENALSKWKTQPIGGEIRPEVWGCVFDHPSCVPEGQDFETCVKRTHASWLMDSGMFSLGEKSTPTRRAEAIRQVQKMGYELHVSHVEILRTDDHLSLCLQVTNRGVAPFYYDWPVELRLTDERGGEIVSKTTAWKLSRVLPGPPSYWNEEIELPHDPAKLMIKVRVANPMPGGKPLRFANQTQAADGWLTLN